MYLIHFKCVFVPGVNKEANFLFYYGHPSPVFHSHVLRETVSFHCVSLRYGPMTMYVSVEQNKGLKTLSR